MGAEFPWLVSVDVRYELVPGMSDSFYAPDGISLGAFCGPDVEGADRQRFQLETEGTVVLTRLEVHELIRSLLTAIHSRPPWPTVPPLTG